MNNPINSNVRQACQPQAVKAAAPQQVAVAGANGMDCSCHNELNLTKLCVNCVKNCWLTSKQVNAEEIVANQICSQKDQTKELWADKAYANSLCVSGSASINELCVNTLKADDIEFCNTYKAAVTFNADMPYALGQSINWDKILDDPNGDVSLAPFKYTTDVPGYYSVMCQVDTGNLQTTQPILGIPVSVIRILVNGQEQLGSTFPYVAFSDTSLATLSGLLILNAGDVVTMDFNILAAASLPVAGTVDIHSNGTQAGPGSRFKIILISENCEPTPPQQPCPPCPVVEIPCQPIPVNPNCNPC